MNTMSYKHYRARVEFDPQDRLFVGHIAGVRDIVGFHGKSVVELEAAFHEAVDDYLATCEKLKRPPSRSFSGRVMLRLPPELHARASAAAELTGMSFNEWAARVLAQAAESS